ncbi:hypothetical protein LSH36_122g03038 [Paralvinella palmiformis]|uniref:Reelin domain-containing protein n=1 Tax=Paralvinella palmiformis TaxID=53620 RepID=A0AAD9JX90_9ANNE|nr:hypothetical protein LSH36_122g03038 [Paralvinella palmiformis]
MGGLLLLWLTNLLAVCYANEFTCDMMRDDHLQQTRMGFQINTGSNIYQPGGQVKVKLGYQTPDPHEMFTFVIQAYKAGSTTETVGSWVLKNNEKSLHCDVNNQNTPDTLYTEQEVISYTVTWQAPEGDKSGDAVDIEFFVIFTDVDGDQHKLLSIGMSPALEPSKLPPTRPEEILQPVIENIDDEDDQFHEERTEDQMKMDAERKLIHEIDEENKASEDDWNKEELAESRKREEEEHEEEMEFERQMRKEEEERLARIRDEIRDKEEYDRMIAEKQIQEEKDVQNNFRKLDEEVIEFIETSGGVQLMAGLFTSILLVVIQKLI